MKRFAFFSITFVILIFLLTLFVFTCSAMNLVVTARNQHELVLREFTISANERFGLKYIHAVDRLPVEEWFEVANNGSIYLVELRFIQLPYLIIRLPNEIPLIYTYSPPWTIVSNMKREIKSLDIKASPFTEQCLLVLDEHVRIEDYVNVGKSIHISVHTD